MKFKATTVGVVVLVALLAVCATVLLALDKDPTPLLVVLVPAALQLVHMGRTDQVAAGQTELSEKVEEVAQNVNGNLSRLIDAKTQPDVPDAPESQTTPHAAGRGDWWYDRTGGEWRPGHGPDAATLHEADRVAALAAADVEQSVAELGACDHGRPFGSSCVACGRLGARARDGGSDG